MRNALLGASMLFCLCGAAAADEYRLQAGDRVRLTILGVSELSFEDEISRDGQINLPLIGLLPASGRTLGELDVEIKSLMNGQIFSFLDRFGNEALTTIGTDDVLLSVAEYRPIAVHGAVRSPGEIPYRAGMTVRRALAVAGAATVVAEDSAVKAAIVSGEILALSAERKYKLALIQRLRQEMALLPDAFDTSAPREALTSDANDPLLQQKLAAARSKAEHIAQSLEKVDERLEILQRREQNEAEGADADTRDKERIDELLERGVVTMERATDVRRAQLLSSARLLQTQDAIARVDQQRAELELEMSALYGEQSIDLIQKVENAELEVAVLDAELEARKEQLALLGAAAPETGETRIFVHRMIEGVTVSAEAAMDDILEPGDIVELATVTEPQSN